MAVPTTGLAICAAAGGLELGVELVLGDGYRCVCYLENEVHAAATLVKRMDEGSLAPAPIWDDLRSFDGKPWRGAVDLITAGFPCQPYSYAGQRRNISDDRNLWPDVARVISEVQPDTVFIENVPGIKRYYYAQIGPDLQRMGYQVEEGIFSAAEVGAHQRRDRFFALAYTGRSRVSAAVQLQREAVGRVQDDGEGGPGDDVGPMADTGHQHVQPQQPSSG